MKTYFKFACLYCGQHMECKLQLCGRQIHCPVCGHRIVIPTAQKHQLVSRLLLSRETWDTWVPTPTVETPTRYHSRTASNAVLA